MKITQLKKRPNIGQDKKLNDKFTHFEKLINELKKKEINQYIEEVNSFLGSNKDFRVRIRKSKNSILKLINKELKLIPKNFYLFRWMSMGISIFGIPL
jgi:DNA-directed RNA polymerase